MWNSAVLNQIARTKSLRQWWLLPCFYDGKIRGNNDVFLLASLSQFSFLFEKYSGFELSSHDKMKRDKSRHRQSFIGFLQETALSTKLLFTLWSLCAWINFTPFHCKGRQIMQRILSLVMFWKKLKQNLTDIRLYASWTLYKSSRKYLFLVLTSPFLSEMLLVSLSLWKETTLDIHCSPVAGLSGWMYIRFGISGSALPATIHRLKMKIACKD